MNSAPAKNRDGQLIFCIFAGDANADGEINDLDKSES